ncbi:hypothetical protein POM88_046586 [Heracleum sosnowskyi]|uniref:DC1 domain-containing protein n=1 Tax=Heracleum sosnowskyi TaxID=360622 RepID=A0AAD8H9K2_9APIA|nr:hypothetical protein POM88_046586 [Heracleum sosnowskyi]
MVAEKKYFHNYPHIFRIQATQKSFFSFFKCARSSQRSCTENEIYDPDILHLRVADELSGYLLGEQFVKAMSMVNNNGTSVFNSTNTIEHWAHPEHCLQLINGNNHKDDDEISFLCDGCVKPIRTDNDHQFYSCVLCKFFLHKFCAKFPKEIKHHISPGLFAAGNHTNFIIVMVVEFGAMVVFVGNKDTYCKTCEREITYEICHKCKKCDYHICGACVMRASVVKHPWDPHPLYLIYEPGMVMNDHEHEFSCEFCSEDIDTNYWFYHCSDCDLSFHLHRCFEKSTYSEYSNVKFGATDIVIDQLHPHSLTFVLNKKVRRCEKCHRDQLGEPVLECVEPCKIIFCRGCYS